MVLLARAADRPIDLRQHPSVFYHIRPGTEGEGAPLSRLKAGCVALSRLMALFEGFDWLQNSRKPATGSDACGFGV